MRKASKFTYLNQNRAQSIQKRDEGVQKTQNKKLDKNQFQDQQKQNKEFPEQKKEEEQKDLYENEEKLSISSFDSEEDLDTNVIALEFDILKNTDNIAMGDPVLCKNCSAVLNKYSKILNAQQFLELSQIQKLEEKQNQKLNQSENQDEDFQIINKKGQELGENESVWICEFCGSENVIMIEQEEIPKQEDVIYLTKANQFKNQQDQEDTSIIFCLDNSGSMSVTSEVKGKKINLKHGLTEEEYEMLKQFMDQGDEQQINQQQNVTYISRKQCVLAAIQQQLEDMKKQKPNKKVGIVTFSDEVVIIGDGHSQEPTIIAGDKLYKQDAIENITIQKATDALKHNINESLDKLTSKFSKLQEKGRTALGPALLSSIILAGQGKPGSMVVICTDGLANAGLGALEYESDEAKQFYQILTEKAKSLGIVISVITIKGEGCKVEILGKLAEDTNGTVTRVDPTEIEKDFAAILGDEVCGTRVELQFQLHKALKFRKEEQQFLKEKGSLYQKQVGNVTVNTKMTFEYSLQSDEVIQENKIDIQALKEVPLQARIYYDSIKGDRYLRVLTQTQKTTLDKKVAEREVDKVDVIHDRIIQQSAQLLQKGRLKSAQQYNSKWSHYVMDNDQMNSQQQVQDQNFNFGGINKKFKKMANNIVQRSKNIFSSNKNQEKNMVQQQSQKTNLQQIHKRQQSYSSGSDQSEDDQTYQDKQLQGQKQSDYTNNPNQSANYILPNNSDTNSINSTQQFIFPKSEENFQIPSSQQSQNSSSQYSQQKQVYTQNKNKSKKEHILSTIKEIPKQSKKIEKQEELFFSASEGSDCSDDDIQADIINYKQARKR